jgi:hypothetical protein
MLFNSEPINWRNSVPDISLERGIHDIKSQAYRKAQFLVQVPIYYLKSITGPICKYSQVGEHQCY